VQDKAYDARVRDGFDDQASLSPDDNQLAFVSTRGNGTNNIWILDIKTRKARNLTGCRPCKLRLGKWTAFSGPPGRQMANGSLFLPTGERTSNDTNFPFRTFRPDSNTFKRQASM